MSSFIVLLALIAVLVFFFVSIYNKLIQLRNYYKNAYAQIDVQLKRRYDLIPNLVESAKGYLKHERETLEAVIRARNTALEASKLAAANPGDATAMTSLTQAEGALSSIMSRLLAVVESYPDLKANQTISQLMEELTSTENKIGFARQAYNDFVAEYNIQREKFPNNIVAGCFNFIEAELLQSTDTAQERTAPKVSFS
ncbi:MAG TPA: LemA family protein [Deltaproteobacteria bacterium]|nr:LemA family protein [Deltaproteobacteria bacterium]